MAKTVKIHAPNADFTGKVAGVVFAAGVGEVDAENTDRIDYFERKGYGIGEKPGGASLEEQDALKGTAKNFSEMTREELNEVALGKGILGAADMKNKEEVIAAIEEAGGTDSED